MSNTPQAIADILAWQAAHQGQVTYSETASTRLASDTADLLTPTDCSGMVARMFAHFAGINVGTYTGNECAYGRLVTTDRTAAANGGGMLPGDVILFDWPGGRSTWDHIAIYAGQGRIWNHGGPGNGPLNWSLADNVDNAVKVMVRRFLTWPTPTDPQPPGDDMTPEQVEDMIANAIRAYREGKDFGVFTHEKHPNVVDGPEFGANDRLTRLENKAGIPGPHTHQPQPQPSPKG